MKTLLLRLHPGQDDDLIRWLEQMDGRHYGAKSQAVKEALRRGIIGQMPQNSAPATPAVNLGEIRAVVEAAVESALVRLGAAITVDSTDQQDDETEALLNSLDAALIIRE